MTYTSEKKFFLHRLEKIYLSVDVTGLGAKLGRFPRC